MYPDKFPSKPTDYYKLTPEGDVLPPDQNTEEPDEDHGIYDESDYEVKEAVRRGTEAARRITDLVSGARKEFDALSPEEKERIRREELESDRQGTHPGTNNPPSKRQTDNLKKSKYEGMELEDGETLDSGQVAQERWYTENGNKKKYTVSVAYVERVRGGKAYRLESKRKIPEQGASKFLISEWQDLERRIDKGEGREI